MSGEDAEKYDLHRRIRDLEQDVSRYHNRDMSLLRDIADIEREARLEAEGQRDTLRSNHRLLSSILLGSLIAMSTALGVLVGDAFDPFDLGSGVELMSSLDVASAVERIQTDELPAFDCSAAVSTETGVAQDRIEAIGHTEANGGAQTFVLRVTNSESDEFWNCLVDTLTGEVSVVWQGVSEESR